MSCVLDAWATDLAKDVFPMPAGPSTNIGFWSLSAKNNVVMICSVAM